MPNFTKSEMRILRRLAEGAWESELRELLEQLQNAFVEWQEGELTSFQLSDKIHEFHDEDARDLFKFYTNPHPSNAVAHALVYGHIDPSDVPDALLKKLTPLVALITDEIKRRP